MLVIRLSRTGRKKQPTYRVVVAEHSAPVKGRFIEVLGHYNPRTKELVVDEERAKLRLSHGAKPSETAEALLEKAGVLERDKKTMMRRPERQKRKEQPEVAATPAPATADKAPAADPAGSDATDSSGSDSKDPEPDKK